MNNPKSAVLRLALLRAKQRTDRPLGTFTLADLQEAHGWAITSIRTRQWKQPELTDEETAEEILEELIDKGKGQSA